MAPKVFIVIAAIFSTASSAPQAYEARGVHHPTVDSSEFSKAISATLDSLPQLTAAFRSISENPDGSFPSDPDAISKIVTASLDIARESMLARQTLQGIPPSQNDLERLKAAEAVLPTISAFMRDMRNVAGNTNRPSRVPTGTLQLDTREYNNRMTDVVVELLPDITEIFEQINQDQGRSNPNDPDFINRVIMAFMPLSRKALLATAKAEGRVVSQEELDRLNRVDAVMPAVTKFMNSLRIPTEFGSPSPAIDSSAFSTSYSGVAPLNLPSTFQRPAPASFKQPAFPSQGSLGHEVKPFKLPSTFETPAPATFKQPAFRGQVASTSTGHDLKPLELASSFETPAPASFKQPAFSGQTSSTSTGLLKLASSFDTPAPASFKQPAFSGQTSSTSTGPLKLASSFDTPAPASFKQPAFSGHTSSTSTGHDLKPLKLASSFETPAPASFKQPAFSGQTSSTSTGHAVKPLQLPSTFETPAPAEFKQPAFTSQSALSASSIPIQTSQQTALTYYTHVLPTSSSSSTVLKAPSFPELTHINPPVYQAFIPTVPDTISGFPTYYSFSIPYGR